MMTRIIFQLQEGLLSTRFKTITAAGYNVVLCRNVMGVQPHYVTCIPL